MSKRPNKRTRVFLNVSDFEEVAKKKMSAPAYHYYAGAAGDERNPVHPRADYLDPERLERTAVQRREGFGDRPRSLDEPGARGKPSEEAERSLLAPGPVHRSNPSSLETEL